jgi:hypothetical protein
MTAERPIIFSGSMVRALLEGRKSQTRRIVKDAPVTHFYRTSKIPYTVGQHLWVRETWADSYEDGDKPSVWTRIYYRADGEPFGRWLDPNTGELRDGIKWRPSIHMPRQASRITLRVTELRVQRLQDISEQDAKAEGAMWHDGRGIGQSGWRHDYTYVHADVRSSFARLWNHLHGPGAWEANPWVAAISFERIKP